MTNAQLTTDLIKTIAPYLAIILVITITAIAVRTGATKGSNQATQKH